MIDKDVLEKMNALNKELGDLRKRLKKIEQKEKTSVKDSVQRQ